MNIKTNEINVGDLVTPKEKSHFFGKPWTGIVIKVFPRQGHSKEIKDNFLHLIEEETYYHVLSSFYDKNPKKVRIGKIAGNILKKLT